MISGKQKCTDYRIHQAASAVLPHDTRLRASGFTLVELLIATVILTAAALGLMAGFSHIARAVQSSKAKSLAVNLAQEKVESLKDIAYFRLMVTTATLTETNVSPNFDYDGPTGYYPPETIVVGDLQFERRIYVHKVKEDASGNFVHVVYTDPDTAVKELRVYVVWKQGAEWKHTVVRNIKDDPNRLATNATFSGQALKSGGGALDQARVEVLQNSVWNKLTDTAGNYSFLVAAGTYTLRASKTGYFTSQLTSQVASAGQTTTANFTLVAMASGTITGKAYIRDHIVISQVVASTVSAQEYVELYNPTTWTWTINDASFDLRYVDHNNVSVTDIALTFANTSIPADGGYYLIANTATVVAAGLAVAADAVYLTPFQNVIRDSKAGGIKITNDNDTVTYDKVGWSKNTAGETAPAQAVEGTQVTLDDGMSPGEQLVRSSVTFTSIFAASGHNAWDSNVNSADFNAGATPQDRSLAYAPKNSATVYSPAGGTPAAGAIVFADDNLSAAVTAEGDGSFSVTSVATGTWTLTASSGSLTNSVSGLAVVSTATTNAGDVILSSTSTNGYVTGQVKDSNNDPLASIQISGGSASTNSDANGNYRLSVPTSTVQIVANSGNVNPNYVSAAQTVSVSLGQVTTNVNFTLSKGAKLRGYSTANGIDPYPGLVVSAKLLGIEVGSGVAGSDGYWIVSNLPTGDYTLDPQAASGESASPASLTKTIAATDAGTTLSVGTFTVSGALGKINGDVKENGVAIQVGVLIIISSGTITDPPPSITDSLRTGAQAYFAASSGADGRYAVFVPGGATYNVHAWYTNAGGTIVRKTATQAVTAGQSYTVNFTWP